jgi:hypothetical protein
MPIFSIDTNVTLEREPQMAFMKAISAMLADEIKKPEEVPNQRYRIKAD